MKAEIRVTGNEYGVGNPDLLDERAAEGQEDDDDFRDDELTKLDIHAYIGQCLQQAVAQDPDRLKRMSTFLTDAESRTLQTHAAR